MRVDQIEMFLGFLRSSARLSAALLIVVALASPIAVEAVDVLTQHNDNLRTGANLSEYVLTVSNVNTGQFGKLFSRVVDGQMYAQPLYVHCLTISNQTRNVVYVCTEHNSVYAFDADDPAASNALWQVNLGPSVPSSDLNNCGDLTPEVGITATPVIDLASGTMYVDAKTKEGGNYFHRLHALDILTGGEKFGGPVAIQGPVGFDALHHHNRPGLLLLNNVVYLGYGSHCDWGPYHGWLFGYNATNLQQVSVFNTTATGGEGAIWSSGMGPAADADGYIYVMTGNGTFDKNTGGPNLGTSFIKLSTSNQTLTVADWFTPHDQAALSAADLDLGSGGPMLFPGTNLLVGVGKTGTMYVLDRNHLGGFVPTIDTNIVQFFTATASTCCVGQTPVYWNGPTNQFLFLWSGGDVLKAFKFTGSSIQTTPLATGGVNQAFRAGGSSLSARGSNATSGIVWGMNNTGGGAVHAFEATNVAHALWNSQQNAARDGLGSYVKFCAPTVANGKVYVPTSANRLVVYGLLDLPFVIWQRQNFNSTELNDPNTSGDLADPDNDGARNLMEYALGLNPRAGDADGLPLVVVQQIGGQRYLSLRYRRVLFATDITYTVEVSGDLATWNSGLGFTVAVGSPVDNGDGTETVTVRDVIPMDSTTTRFLRLHISRTPPPPPPSPQVTLVASNLNPAGNPFWVRADITNVPVIAHVDFWVDGVFYHRENVSPYYIFGDDGTNPNFGTLPAGAHMIIAEVYSDETTLVVTSPAITVTE